MAKSIDRRLFLKSSALFAVAVSVPVLVSCKDDTASTPQTGEACKTTDDILGPYYKAGAPLREDITPANSGGIPLLIAGSVLSNCDQLVQNALVEIWNANDKGEYDTSDQYLYRGGFKTGADGLYRFKTIIPGKYLNGNTYRPSHLHFRITAPGHQELVSQIYFKDDPYIASDRWASDPKAKERILTITKDANDVDKVKFDIYLAKV